MEEKRDLITIPEFVRQLLDFLSPQKVREIFELIKEPGFPLVQIGEMHYIAADLVDYWKEKRAEESTQMEGEE